MNKLKQAAPWVLNVIGLVFSIYLVWGWMTISDIKSAVSKKGQDLNQVMNDLLPTGEEYSSALSENGKTNFVYKPARIPSEFRRFNWGFDTIIVQRDGTIIHESIEALTPFTHLSEGVLNCLFSFGAGFLMSFVLLLVQRLKSQAMSLGYISLRPAAGGLVSSCLFIVLYSGGQILWQNATNMNATSVGVVAIIGTIWCERFPELLTASFNRNVSK